MNHILIRDARPEDAEALLIYLKQIGGETQFLAIDEEGLPLSVEEEQNYLRTLQHSELSKDLLALSANGEILGNAAIKGFTKERMKHMASVAVSVKKDHWSQGVGSALMQHMIDFAKTQSIEVITLEVLSDNQRAIALYEKFGFVKFGHLDKFFKIAGRYYGADYMKLDLLSAADAEA